MTPLTSESLSFDYPPWIDRDGTTLRDAIVTVSKTGGLVIGNTTQRTRFITLDNVRLIGDGVGIGVEIDRAAAVTLIGCHISGFATGISIVDCWNVNIIGTTIVDNTSVGVFIDSTVEGNEGTHGVQITGGRIEDSLHLLIAKRGRQLTVAGTHFHGRRQTWSPAAVEVGADWTGPLYVEGTRGWTRVDVTGLPNQRVESRVNIVQKN